MTTIAQEPPLVRRRRRWEALPYLLILPTVVYLGLFFVWPMIQGFGLALRDESGNWTTSALETMCERRRLPRGDELHVPADRRDRPDPVRPRVRHGAPPEREAARQRPHPLHLPAPACDLGSRSGHRLVRDLHRAGLPQHHPRGRRGDRAAVHLPRPDLDDAARDRRRRGRDLALDHVHDGDPLRRAPRHPEGLRRGLGGLRRRLLPARPPRDPADAQAVDPGRAAAPPDLRLRGLRGGDRVDRVGRDGARSRGVQVAGDQRERARGGRLLDRHPRSLARRGRVRATRRCGRRANGGFADGPAAHPRRPGARLPRRARHRGLHPRADLPDHDLRVLELRRGLRVSEEPRAERSLDGVDEHLPRLGRGQGLAMAKRLRRDHHDRRVPRDRDAGGLRDRALHVQGQQIRSSWRS